MLMSNHLIGFGVAGRPFAGTSAAAVTQGASTGGSQGFTYRTVIASSAIGAYSDFSRFVWQSGSGGALNLTKAYIGILANTCDFSATPTQILFSGGAALAIGSSSTEGQSDIMSFAINAGINYVISQYFNAVPANSALSASLPSGWTQHYKSGDDAATVTTSGYTPNTVINAFKRLEV